MYGDEQVRLINDLFSVSKSHHQEWLRAQLKSTTNQQVLVIRKLLKEKLARAELLARLEREIGFGGLIHDFKNYVLRGEGQYLDSFLKRLTTSQNFIEAFKQLSHLSVNE